MKLRVKDGYQVNHGGKMHREGDTLDVKEPNLTSHWLAAGYVEEVKEDESKARSSEQQDADGQKQVIGLGGRLSTPAHSPHP